MLQKPQEVEWEPPQVSAHRLLLQRESRVGALACGPAVRAAAASLAECGGFEIMGSEASPPGFSASVTGSSLCGLRQTG